MHRRALPVLAAAAAVALLPGTANAAPAEALRYQSYHAQADVDLPDGRHVSATVSEIPRIDGTGADAGLTLRISPALDCRPIGDCDSGTGYGYASLPGGGMGFHPRLSGVTLTDVPVTLTRTDWSSFPWHGVEESVVVDVRLTGTGASVHTAEHGATCGSGDPGCQATRVAVERSGDASVDVDGLTGSGSATLFFGRSIDVAVPQFGSAGGN